VVKGSNNFPTRGDMGKVPQTLHYPSPDPRQDLLILAILTAMTAQIRRMADALDGLTEVEQ